MTDPWRAITEHNRQQVKRRAGALAWRSEISLPLSTIWIDGDLAGTPEARDVVHEIAPAAIQKRVAQCFASPHPGDRRRAVSAIHDRLALSLALSELGAKSKIQNPKSKILSHTLLGQPIVCDPNGARSADLQVSFSHDGDAHLCVLARSPDLRGVGIDVVYLPRLRGRSRDYLRRFANHFMSDVELAHFEPAATRDAPDDLLLRVCAHFSLMESASKALGTGLKIGAGMGKKESLPKQSIGVSSLEPVEWLLGPEVERRCREIGGNRLEGHWATDEEYGVSLALLFV